MQTKDVSDAAVYACFDQTLPNRSAPVLALLQAKGVPFKVAAAKLERMVSAGLLEYGTSLNWVWLTKDGAATAIHAPNTEEPCNGLFVTRYEDGRVKIENRTENNITVDSSAFGLSLGTTILLKPGIAMVCVLCPAAQPACHHNFFIEGRET